MKHRSKIKKNPMDVGCAANETKSCSYVSVEDMPEWIKYTVNRESWTRGRLHCPYCNNRIGSFNFVNEMKCDCGKYITLPVRITNSKVDISFNVK
ncbi:E3 ubiquitin-protein ligase RNF180-like isoform X2 [Ptiloglossa arizonensis]|uniref:E3 ubiquitin-protein ligase RNF180-like isoform X2 n=1 Tax=Ptiloglossa arizonensis TaxID=3350558 RepID=UPI003FA08556